MKKYIIKFSILLTITAVFTACETSNQNLYKDNKSYESKNNYIKKANLGEIDAILALDKYYNYLYSKEGLEQHKNWYKTISESNNIDLIHNYTKYMVDNYNYFINYEYKILNLFKKLPNDKAKYLITKLDFYNKTYNGLEEDSLLEKAFSNLKEEELHKLMDYYAFNNLLNKKHFKKLQKLVKNKSYKVPNFLHHHRITSYKIKDEERKANLKKVLNLDEKTILEIARISVKKRDRKEAIELYKKAIELGTKDKEAYYFIATNTRSLYKKEQKEKAISYYKEAMNLGHKKAAATLLKIYSEDKQYLDKYIALKKKYESDDETLILYANQLLSRTSYKKAIGILEKLEKRGNQEALILLAKEPILYRYNEEETLKAKQYKEKIINSNNKHLINKYFQEMKKHWYSYNYKSKKELEDYLKKQANKGNLKEIRYLVKYTRIPKEEKRNWLMKAYKFGDNKAAYDLVLHHDIGEEKTLEIYENLVKQNDIKAMINLADFHAYKKKKDIKQAIYWFEKAAKYNNITALRSLTSYYTCATCTDKIKADYSADYNKALKYVKYLANKKDSFGMSTLGWFYNLGLAGLQKDYKKAIYWYEKAAVKENKTALRNLGLLYKEGNHQVPKDIEKAISYLKKAVFLSSTDAANDLGLIYQTKKDYKQAIYYYEQSILYRNSSAHYNLGLLYELGLGVKKDIPKALSYYKKSNSEDAKKRIQKLKK